MKKTVKLTLSMELVQLSLSKIITSPHKDLIAKIIVENLATTEVGVSQLMSAMMGIEEKLPWIIGDECLVKIEDLGSWMFEKTPTIQKGIGMKKGMMMAKIIDINLRKEASIRIQFTALVKEGLQGVLKEKSVEQWIGLDSLIMDLDLKTMGPRDVGDVL